MWAAGVTFTLVLYTEEERASTRHRTWKTTAQWEQVPYRTLHTRIERPSSIPADVLEEARQRVIDSIKIVVAEDDGIASTSTRSGVA
jgi:hypothetical protein